MIVILNAKDPTSIFDRHITLICPHCQNATGISAVSIPDYEHLRRFQPRNVGIAYKCDACSEPIFLKFAVERYDFGNYRVHIQDEYDVVERPLETYEYKYLPAAVADDFHEALISYSNGCFNAFAAMCRRTIQSLSSELGAEGKSKVEKQISELKEMEIIDEPTFEELKTIIISGHDGSHPYLPVVSSERATVLLQIMKDVLYEVFVRKAKLEEANTLRKAAIEDGKAEAGV